MSIYDYKVVDREGKEVPNKTKVFNHGFLRSFYIKK